VPEIDWHDQEEYDEEEKMEIMHATTNTYCQRRLVVLEGESEEDNSFMVPAHFTWGGEVTKMMMMQHTKENHCIFACLSSH
jgi:hypothetical protein